MSRRVVHKPRPFTVFTDTTDTSSDTILVSEKGRLHRSQNTSSKCAVLRELNTDKGFTLSPKSQVMAEKENFDPVLMRLVCHSQSAASNMAAPLTDKGPMLGFVYKTPDQGPVPDNDILMRAPREKTAAGNVRANGSSDRRPALTPTHRILRRSSNENMATDGDRGDTSDSSVTKSRPRRQTVGDRAKYDVDDLVMLLDQMALRRLEASPSQRASRDSAEPDATPADKRLELSPYQLGVPPSLSLHSKSNHYQPNADAATSNCEQQKRCERKLRKRVVLTGL